MDGPLAPVPCASVTRYRRCNDCRDEKTCAISAVMRRVRDAMADVLDRTTLATWRAARRRDHWWPERPHFIFV
jgi:DNA-binding IscR family transcriptional regulator